MTLKNSSTHYGVVSKFLHWLTAFLIIGMLVLGFLLATLQNTTWSNFSYCLHESIGIFILLLTGFRIFWHTTQTKVPQFPISMAIWQKKLARLSHHLLYIALLGMPLSGWVSAVSAGYPPKFMGLMTLSLPVPQNNQLAAYSGSVHKFLAWTIIFLVSLHILAAIKHYVFDRDVIFDRMFPRKWMPQKESVTKKQSVLHE